jgi:hypothetical protein
MLRSEFPDAGEQSPEALLDAYESVLAETVETVGRESVIEATGLDPETVAAVAEGTAAELSLEDAAAVLATDSSYPDAETIQAEAQDILLLGMKTAVLDVEALASGIDSQLEPKEIQQKIEGRYPMTLREYAVLHSYIEQRKQ